MGHPLHLDSIRLRLDHALPHFLAVPGVSQRVTGGRRSRAQFERVVKNLLAGNDESFTVVPAFQEVQDWVATYWDPERQTQPPAGTVSIGDVEGNLGEAQLDAPTAACKLLLASAVHGTEIVANLAIEFAGHGMIEVRHFYLLKGLPVSSPQRLDDHCTLLPYGEALQAVSAASAEQVSEQDLHWPSMGVEDVSVLEARSFECRRLTAYLVERHESCLLQCGPKTFELILGLVWGGGFRTFGGGHGVPAPIAATLPFFHANASRGSWSRPALLNQAGFRRHSTNRPLNVTELLELTGKYANLPEQAQRALSLALRRLRDGTERIVLEDRVIDVSIALEALFMKDGEDWDQKKIVSRRASWYFADSHLEREHTRSLLKAFYDRRSAIVHGNTPGGLTGAEESQLSSPTADVENVARSSLKDMISEGRPQNWEDSKNPKLTRHNLPRPETKILSVKSDSMSWTIAEQTEIDQALEAVWNPEVDSTHPPTDKIAKVYREGPYVMSLAVRLFEAHPRWPGESYPIDERTKYNCGSDVRKHLQRAREAAAKRGIRMSSEDPTTYLAQDLEKWRGILQRAGLL